MDIHVYYIYIHIYRGPHLWATRLDIRRFYHGSHGLGHVLAKMMVPDSEDDCSIRYLKTRLTYYPDGDGP